MRAAAAVIRVTVERWEALLAREDLSDAEISEQLVADVEQLEAAMDTLNIELDDVDEEA